MENDHQEFENAKEAIACVRKEKTALGISLGATINNLVIKVDKDKETKLKKKGTNNNQYYLIDWEYNQNSNCPIDNISHWN